MADLRGLLGELRRRGVLRTLGVYAAASWLLIEVAATVAPIAGLPEWVPRAILWLVLAGLPAALVIAWLFQFTPHGLERDRAAQPEAAPTGGPPAARVRLAVATPWLILALLAGSFVARGFAPPIGLVQEGVLPERATILVADFQNAADPALGRTASEWLRAELEQSPFLRVPSGQEIGVALRRMKRDPAEPLDEATARELAVREGYPAVLSGDIAAGGSGHLMTARLIASGDGAVLARFTGGTDRPEGFLAALNDLATNVRERIGESARSIRSMPPLSQVTTASLEALQAYTMAHHLGYRAGDFDAAIPLLERAIELDSTFAMAYRSLWMMTDNSYPRKSQLLRKAYDLRHRLPPFERLLIEERRELLVTDPDSLNPLTPPSALLAHEEYARLYPNDMRAWNNYSSWLRLAGRVEEAERVIRRALAKNRDWPDGYETLLRALYDQGKLDEAERVLYEWRDASGESDRWDAHNATLAYLRGDTAFEAKAPNAPPGWRAQFWTTRGQVERAERIVESFTRRPEWANRAYDQLELAANRARALAATTQDTARALRELHGALARWPVDALLSDDGEQLLNRIGTTFARFGTPTDMTWVLEYLDGPNPKVGLRWSGRYNVIHGIWLRRNGRPLEAIERLRLVRPHIAPDTWPELGRAWELAGRPDSAVAAYERYLASHSIRARIVLDQEYLAEVLERLGELHAQRGEVLRGAACYRWFAELWHNADAVLQPRVAAAVRRAAELEASAGLRTDVRERGHCVSEHLVG